MNKNPFGPQHSYPPMPPLPPGPPPPPGQVQDYSAYWAAAVAAGHPPPPPGGSFNAAWTPAQPPQRPPPEQSALYANYGYGGQQSHWQRQQQQAQTHYPPPPMQAPGPPGYSPYQPAPVFPNAYPPHPIPQPVLPPPPPMQQPYGNNVNPPPPQQMHRPPQQYQPQPPRNVHPSPQQLPPAKRPRFDGPSGPSGPRNQPPPPPQFQPPPAPATHPIGVFSGPAPSGRSGPTGPRHNTGGGNRPGSLQRGKQGSSLSSHRGGMGTRGGRGGSFTGGRGAPPLRGHGSKGNFGGRDSHRRNNNASFTTGSGHGSLRSGPRGYGNKGGRHDGPSSHAGKDGPIAPASSRDKENRRTLTDFKIVGLEIPSLSWSWGTLYPPNEPSEPNAQKAEASESQTVPEDEAATSSSVDAQPKESTSPQPNTEAMPPFCRARLYFHTPVTADDARPITVSTKTIPSDSRKGKRKKLEDDDGDRQEGRTTPPPPPGLHDDRSSVAETASEADWLMAAIVDADGSEAHEDSSQQNNDGDDSQSQHAPPRENGVSEVADGGELNGNGDNDIPGLRGSKLSNESLHDGAGSTAQRGGVAGTNGLQSKALDSLGTENGHSASIADGDGGDHEVLVSEPSLEETNEDDNSEAQVVEHLSPEADPSVNPDSKNEVTASSPVQSTSQLLPPDEEAASTQATELSPAKSTRTVSTQPTLVDFDSQDVENDGNLSPRINGFDHDDSALDLEQTQPLDLDHSQADHLPEPPASNSSASERGDSGAATSSQSLKVASANRLSISYGSNRRLVIDAEIVQTLKLYRKEGRIEVEMTVTGDSDSLNGIIIEGLSEDTKAYVPLQAEQYDSSVPPFSQLSFPAPVTLFVYLDTHRPLSEPKWIRTGDIADWLRTMFGRMFWVAGDAAAEGWERKITVVDPDPPPTIWTVLENWADHSPAGVQSERQRFVKTHMTEVDNRLEVLLRLVRGERATPFSSAPTISGQSLSGPLLSALSQDSPHAAQQTHVSLAVLAIFRMAVEYAEKSAGEAGKLEAEEKAGEIIRSLPSHLIYKSLDGMFKEWRVEKKGR